MSLTLKPFIFFIQVGHSDEDAAILLQELKVMKEIGPHNNIITLLGYCTQNGPLYIILEIAESGNLLDFLRQHEEECQNLALENTECDTEGECNAGDREELGLSQKNLIQFALQVAKGMSYLASKMVRVTEYDSTIFAKF